MNLRMTAIVAAAIHKELDIQMLETLLSLICASIYSISASLRAILLVKKNSKKFDEPRKSYVRISTIGWSVHCKVLYISQGLKLEHGPGLSDGAAYDCHRMSRSYLLLVPLFLRAGGNGGRMWSIVGLPAIAIARLARVKIAFSQVFNSIRGHYFHSAFLDSSVWNS